MSNLSWVGRCIKYGPKCDLLETWQVRNVSLRSIFTKKGETFLSWILVGWACWYLAGQVRNCNSTIELGGGPKGTRKAQNSSWRELRGCWKSGLLESSSLDRVEMAQTQMNDTDQTLIRRLGHRILKPKLVNEPRQY